MLSNSVIGGALLSAYLTALVLHLNPAFPLRPSAVLPLALALFLAYGVNLAVVFYALVVLRQLLATEVLSPGWLSVRLLSWICTMAAGVAAVIMWLNVSAFGLELDPPTVSHLTAAAIMVSGSAVVFLLIALAHLGRRGGGTSAVLLVMMMVLSIAAPLGARGRGVESPISARPTVPVSALQVTASTSRVIVLTLDGASLDVISPAVAEGRLPNFGRILDRGAVLHLATLRPTQPEPVWSAVATGRAPAQNGIRAAALYQVRGGDPQLSLLPDYCFAQALVRFGFLREIRHDARSIESRTVWSILGDVGIPVAIVGWPLTHPALPVSGVLVSDRFHVTDPDLEFEDHAAVWPPPLVSEIRRIVDTTSPPDPLALVSRVDRSPGRAAFFLRDRGPILADRVHLQIWRELKQVSEARFVAVHFPGLDAVGHYFLRYANPAPFGDVSEDERRRFGRVLDDYYAFIDMIVGRGLDSLGPDDLLLVVSGFGMQPLSPGKRLLERLTGNPDISGSHEAAPDGFLMAYGTAVAHGRPQRASVLDFTPTVLYFLGLPAGRDMDGFARTDLFRSTFTGSRPITFIPTYGR
jgi:Type I phosphodiesterase / nucleotide pyrophosphatase